VNASDGTKNIPLLFTWLQELLSITASELILAMMFMTHHKLWYILPRNLLCEGGIKPADEAVR
jgi:hypothetical protein